MPCVMRWPGVIAPGRVINDITSLQDFIPTFAAAAGEPDLVEKVKKGCKIGDRTFKVHLDGANLLPFLSGKEKESPRKGFLYWSDDGDLMALRVNQYKIVFSEQRSTGLDVWREPLVRLRIPKLFDLRSDPFERGEESFKYNDWFVEHVPLQYVAQAVVHPMARKLQGLPAAPQGGELHGRSDRGSADAQELTPQRPPHGFMLTMCASEAKGLPAGEVIRAGQALHAARDRC